MKGTSMDTRILEQLEEAFSEEFKLVGNNLEATEQLVNEKMQLLGRMLLQRLVGRDRNGYKGSPMACQCGASMKFVQHRPKDIHTVFGWIKLKRAYYHCPDCGRSLIPYDLESGLGGEQLSPALAKACCLLAVDGWTKKLIDDLKGQRKKHRAAKREAIETLIRYISTNEEQMRYDVFRAKGYDIGSGAVEGACKNAVGKRLKQSGMIWSRAGSSATLALRVCWLNNRSDELWRQKPLAA